MKAILLIKKLDEAGLFITSAREKHTAVCIKDIYRLTIKKQYRAPIIKFSLSTILFSSQFAIAAPVTSKWSCDAWVKDNNNSCVEIQTCTRSICNTKGKLANCRTETKTSKSTDLDCTPAPVKPSTRILGKGSMSLGVVQKIKKPVARPIPVLNPVINKRFDEADALFGKRTNVSGKKRQATAKIAFPNVVKTPVPAGPMPIPYPNIDNKPKEKKPLKLK